jgi:hypothetical protein
MACIELAVFPYESEVEERLEIAGDFKSFEV